MARYPATQKQRCISAVRLRLKQHKIGKAMRLVSDLEGVPTKTLEAWWYAYLKQQREAAKQVKAEGKIRPSQGKPDDSDRLHSLSAPPAPQDRPRPARLDTDSGLLKCSRCNGQHIEKREGETFYCQICEVILLFEGFPTEKTSPYYPLGDLSWMV